MKILTLNTWQERGPWRLRWDLILKGIEEHQPDLVVFQEVFNPGWAQEIKAQTDFPYLVFHAEPSGLMILSQHEVKSSSCFVMKTQSPTEDYLRYALFAEIKIKKMKLAVFNTHLSWKPEEGDVREAQASELLNFIEQKSKGSETIVVGDFNAVPGTPEIRKMEAARFADAFGSLYPNAAGFTWNNENPYVRNCGHPMPDRRIDYIFTRSENKLLLGLESVKLVLNRPDYSGIWPSDHFGLLTTFKEV